MRAFSQAVTHFGKSLNAFNALYGILKNNIFVVVRKYVLPIGLAVGIVGFRPQFFYYSDCGS